MPLKDIKVIDLTRLLSGPYATMTLADLGAEVIKVETPTGDDTRHLGPPFIGDWSTYFLSINRNKKSISLNLKKEAGKKAFLKLVEDADVVIENFRPGAMERLGLSYEDLRKVNPKIIFASISGFGQEGIYSKRPGYDVLAQGMGGLMSVTGEKDGPPQKAGFSFADLGTGMWVAFGIMVALWERNKTGKGQWIDAALLDTVISWQTYLASSYFATGENPRPLGTEHPNIAPYQAFEASDGHFIVAIATDEMWRKFKEKIDIDILHDEKFDENKGRVTHRDKLIPILQEEFKKRSRKEWEEFFMELGIPVGPVNQLSDILNDPYVFEREMVVDTHHPDIGDIKTLGLPLRFSDMETSLEYSFPAKLGEHSAEILKGVGYSEEEIKEMYEKEVIYTKD